MAIVNGDMVIVTSAEAAELRTLGVEIPAGIQLYIVDPPAPPIPRQRWWTKIWCLISALWWRFRNVMMAAYESMDDKWTAP